MAGPWYIDPDWGGTESGTESEPYASWANFITGEATDLTSGGGADNFVYLKNAGTNMGNANGGLTCTPAGFTQDATNFLTVKLWPGEAFFSAKMILDSSGSGAQAWDPDPNTRIEGIWIETSGEGANLAAGLNTGCWVDSCVIVSANSGGITPTTNCVVQNNLVIAANHGIRASAGSASGQKYYRNTCIGVSASGTGIDPRAGNADVRDNVVWGSWTNEYVTSPAASSTNNAGQLAAGSQPTNIQNGYVQITSDPFVDSGSGDYRAAAAGQLAGAGSTIAGLTVDAEGVAVNSPPDIGYLVAAAGGASGAAIAVIAKYYRNLLAGGM